MSSFASSFETELGVDANAVDYLKPGLFFRKACVAYADRKIIILGWLHLVASVMIYAHFGLEKFNYLEEITPEDADRYWLRVLAPPLTYGAKHVILFQLAVIPLTMCRLTIVHASSTFLKRLIPFNQILKSHIVIGYSIIALTIMATLLFFIFYGILCSDGDDLYCSRLSSEIMMTGYLLVITFTGVGVTAYLRNTISYKIFYTVHHVVFIGYFVTIAHTLDRIQRDEGGRSQAFIWFSASILLYCCDRAAMYLNHRYQSVITASTLVSSPSGQKMVILQIAKPGALHFYPGQYAYLKIPQLDNMMWKPFSIGSSPDSDLMDFCIEVKGEGSWTRRLSEMLEKHNIGQNSLPHASIAAGTVLESSKEISVEIMGPYGTSLGEVSNYSHALLFGSGTGIVPALSMFKQHVNQMLQIDPDTYALAIQQHIEMVSTLDSLHESKKGSILKNICNRNQNEEALAHSARSINQGGEPSPADIYVLRILSRMVQKQVALYFFIMVSPVVGAIFLGATLSWNTLPFEPYPIMKHILIVGTIGFQFIFINITLTVQQRNTLNFFIDLCVGIIGIFVDGYWFHEKKWGQFNSVDLSCYGIIIGFMFMRLWYSATNPDTNPIQRSNERLLLVTLDKLHLVWTTRSTADVFELYPEILKLWDDLIESWGSDNARKMCEISIYCTDKNKDHQDGLMDEYKDSSLFKEGALKFGRPQLDKVLEKESEDNMMTRSASHTLVVFCGGQSMAKRVIEAKILNDITLRITGNAAHKSDLVIESYGGEATKREPTKRIEKGEDSNTASSDNKKNPSTLSALDPLRKSSRNSKVHAQMLETHIGVSSRRFNTESLRDMRSFTRRAPSNLNLTSSLPPTQFLDLSSEINIPTYDNNKEKKLPRGVDSQKKGDKAEKKLQRVSFFDDIQQQPRIADSSLKQADNEIDDKIEKKEGEKIEEEGLTRVDELNEKEGEEVEGDELRVSLLYE